MTDTKAQLEHSIAGFQDYLSTYLVDNHEERARKLHVFAHSLSHEYKSKEEVIYLEKAIQIGREAVARTPKDHPDLGQLVLVIPCSHHASCSRSSQFAIADQDLRH